MKSDEDKREPWITGEHLQVYVDLVGSDALSMFRMSARETGGDWDEMVTILTDTFIEAVNQMVRLSVAEDGAERTAVERANYATAMHMMVRTAAAASLALVPIYAAVEQDALDQPLIHRPH